MNMSVHCEELVTTQSMGGRENVVGFVVLNGVLVFICAQMRLWNGLVFVSLHPSHRVILV